MNLKTAAHYAEHLVNWIMPHAWPAQVAGSIRRERPVCNDVDIVCIPKIHEVRDLFGGVASRENLLHSFLKRYAADKQCWPGALPVRWRYARQIRNPPTAQVPARPLVRR